MTVTSIHEAKCQLSKLIDLAIQGEEVVIAKSGKPVVRLVPILVDTSPRVGDQWKGRVRISDDFDALPDDIAEALGMSPRRRFF